MNKLFSLFRENDIKIVVFIISISSLLSFSYFFFYDLIFAYGDAASRLNIARKITDNLTPGIGQIGTIWLPFPHVLTLPFVANKFLWQSGIAGYIISGTAYVLSALFLYKLILLLTKKVSVSLFATLILSFNINFLYLQTTAMSETFFVFTLIASMYYFSAWTLYKKDYFLFPLAITVSLSTFTRYEGYFVLVGVVFIVLLTLIYRKSKFNTIEGKLISFTTLASVGVLTWALYQAVIFKDPIYWFKIYTQQASIVSTEENRSQQVVKKEDQNSNAAIKRIASIPVKLIPATGRFLSASAQFNGILLSLGAIIAAGVIIGNVISKKKEKNLALLSVFVPVFAGLFVILSIAGDFPLRIPDLSISAVLDNATNRFPEYNIRYGLVLLPLVIVLVAVASGMNKFFAILFSLVFIVQTLLSFSNTYYFQYSLPYYFANVTNKEKEIRSQNSFQWLQQNYDGGLILISTLQHEPAMLYFGFDYKNYIHEGTQKFWLTSIKSPQVYAEWIYMNTPSVGGGQMEDSVTRELYGRSVLAKYYTQVYSDNKVIIYKLKGTPTRK